ncbi:MAG: enoyl-CoA hydratase/isomerase family protein, partial [Calditrichaeota bacterium]
MLKGVPSLERFHNVQLEIGEGVATLWLDRPERHHAIDRGMMDGLEAALDRLDQQTDCRVLILTATGEESFCAGGDLTYFASLKTETAVRSMCHRMIGLLTRLSNERRVVVAAVNGQALGGGCEMLAYAHLRVASRRARFAFRQAVNGIVT